MPRYRTREWPDQLIGHPGQSSRYSQVSRFAGPSLCLNLDLSRSLPFAQLEHLHEFNTSFRGNPLYTVPCHKFQPRSLLSHRFVEHFNLQKRLVKSDYETRIYKADASHPAGLSELLPRKTHYLLTLRNVVVAESPRDGRVRAHSKPLDITFVVTGSVPPWYACLGGDFIDAHFAATPTVSTTYWGLRDYAFIAMNPAVFCSDDEPPKNLPAAKAPVLV